MKAKSAKQKGNRFEYYLKDRFAQDLDVNTRKNPLSGAGIDKGDLRIPSHDIIIEAKNQKSISLIDWWEQTKRQAQAHEKPVLILRHPKKKEFDESLVVLDLEYFIQLLRNTNNGTITVEYKMEYSQKRVLQNLKESIQKVIKEFEL